MIRLFGFLLGSALSVGAILLILGPPEFRAMAPSQPLPATVETPLPAATTAPLAEEAPVPPPQPAAEPQPLPAPETAELPQVAAVEPRWHTVWSPFASRIAANGFVSRLEAVTGYDYRVVKIDTGVYEVALTYMHDDELQDKLAVIASATGLELPDS